MSLDVEKFSGELLQLKELLDKGIITKEEFEEQKRKLLNQESLSKSIEDKTETIDNPDENKKQVNKESVINGHKINLSKKQKIIIALVLVIALSFGYIAIDGPILTGDDRIAYELILDASKQFKSPSSVRVVSGTVLNAKDSKDGESCLWCGISAVNGFGARTTSYYYIAEDGTVMETDYSGALNKDINVDLINKKLEKKLKY